MAFSTARSNLSRLPAAHWINNFKPLQDIKGNPRSVTTHKVHVTHPTTFMERLEAAAGDL